MSVRPTLASFIGADLTREGLRRLKVFVSENEDRSVTEVLAKHRIWTDDRHLSLCLPDVTLCDLFHTSEGSTVAGFLMIQLDVACALFQTAARDRIDRYVELAWA